MSDSDYPFRTRHELVRAIHDAFQLAADNRKGRDFDEWNAAEVQSLLRASQLAADRHGQHRLSIDAIKSAEHYVRGSAVYGSTWVYTVVDNMRRPAASCHA